MRLPQTSRGVEIMLGYGFQECGEFSVRAKQYAPIIVKREFVETQVVNLGSRLPSQHFRFKLTLPDGRPLPNGAIVVQSGLDETLRTLGNATINQLGEAEFKAYGEFDLNTRFTAKVLFGGFSSAIKETFPFTGADQAPVVLSWVITPPLLVEGRVIDENGQGIENANVKINARNRLENGNFGSKKGSGASISNKDGRFWMGIGKANELRIEVDAGAEYSPHKESLRIDANSSKLRLQDIILFQPARIRIKATIGGEAFKKARVRFRNAPRFIAGRLDDEGVFSDSSLRRSEVRDADDPLEVLVEGPQGTSGWIDIRSKLLAGEEIRIDLPQPKLGVVAIDVGDDISKAETRLTLHYGREEKGLLGMQIKTTTAHSHALWEKLAAGRYYGYTTAFSKLGQATSALFSFEIHDKQTTTVKVKLHGLAKLDLILPPGEEDFTRLSLQETSTSISPDAGRTKFLGGDIRFSPMLHYAPNERAFLTIHYQRNGKSKRTRVELPIAQEYESVTLDITEKIAQLRAEIEADD